MDWHDCGNHIDSCAARLVYPYALENVQADETVGDMIEILLALEYN